MESAILNLSSKLSSPILDEFWLLWGMEKEQQKLRSNLEAIEAVLQDAEVRQVKEKAVKDWLRKMRDVAYDADDLVDEFMVEDLRRKVEIRDGMLKKVHNFFSPLNPLKFRFDMAHKMQELRKRLDEIAEEKDKFLFKERVVEIHPPISRTRETHSCVIESEVYGRDDEKAKIIDSLIKSGKDEVLSVFSIVGMGGLGKTTLAQLVYSDERVAAHFDLKMWVYVSEDFDVGRLVKEILQSVTKHGSDPLSMELLQTHLREKLSGKRYLLVLDDVWNEVHEKWDKLKTILLKCGAQGSKIMVTTRSNTVASIMGSLPAHQLGTLSESHSLSLFKQLAFGNKQEQPNEKLVIIGEEIVRKCGGVPLAVKTLGSLMYSKESEREWLLVRDSESWLEDEDTGILPALRLSYNHLTPSLKECFAYCVVFPKGDEIGVDELIKHWIAQGFIQSSEENELLEEKGEEYFKTLWSRSFFQDVERNDDGDMESCRMHDLVHDLARAVAGNEFAFSGTHNQTALKKTRHLSMYSLPEVALKKYMEAFKNFDKMHSMVFFRMNSKFNISEVNVCFRFRRLRLLVLRKIRINHLPKSIGKLKHLRYLDLSDTRIKELPKTICNLFNLQTLILVGTRIKKFPKGIRRMISLRHVELGGYTKHMPNGIGELTSLRTLSEFIVGEKSGCGIEELKFLNLLMGHLRIERLDNIKNAQCAREARLKEKKYLRSLSLSYGKVGDTPEGNLDNVIQYLEPHSRLERLSIYDYMGQNFPTWMEQINLVKLSLYNCQRCQHLPRLGRLRFLESLRLEQMDGMKYIIESDSGYDKKSMFPSLKHLHIFDLCNLKGWSIDGVDGVVPSEPDDQLLPRLCQLFVHNCPNLTSFPKGLGALEELRMINVGCSKLDISSSVSLKKLVLSEMPNLEGLSTQQVASNDGQSKEVEAHLFLRCLLSLDISTCPKLTHFPSLFLPALESFMMRGVGLHRIQLISSSLSMETISISSMPNLESWSSQVDDDNDRQENKTGRSDDGRLSTVIVECPEMIDMPQLLPSLDELYIRKSNEKLLRSIAHYASLSSLTINGFPEMTSLPLHVFGPNHTNLHELIIEDCPKLMFLSDWLENLPALKTMKIEECPDLVLMLPDGLHQHWLSSLQDLRIINSCKKQTVFPGGDGIVFHSLRKLYMEGWESLESLCEGLQQNLIPTLHELTIFKCPNLVPFPNGFQQQCLNSLKVLRIWYCKKLTSFPGGGGDAITLSSLKELEIFRCENLEHMFEGLKENHITSLEKMSIIDCPKLDDLPEWLGNLSLLEELSINSCLCLRGLPESVKNFTSLRRLEIRNCPNMNALPTELQKLLSDEQLQISNCPLLERRMQCNDKDESTHAAWILPQRLMELLKKTPCFNPSSSSFS